MQRLHEQLQQSDRIAITAISGMGGIGKTELALQYAQRYYQSGSYPGGVCWLRVRNLEVGTQLVTFARTRLLLTLPDDLDFESQVAFCWRNWPEGEALVVFDDVTDYPQIEPFLPPADPHFKVLFTTRLQLGQSVKPFAIEVLEEAAALELLQAIVGAERIEPQEAAAKVLCQWLGYLPLALELVGRYLAGKADLSLVQMQQRLEAKTFEARALLRTEPGMTATLGVAAAFELSWQALDESAQRLGGMLSLLAPAPIPWELVEQCFPDWDTEALEEVRDEGLLGLHLLQRTGGGTYQLHPLIRRFFQVKLAFAAGAEQLKRGVCQALMPVAQQLPAIPTQEQIVAVAPCIPHLAEVATTLLDWVQDEEVLWCFEGLGKFYAGQGAYAQALPWYEQCLGATRTRFWEEHPDVASSLHNLAGLYASQGRYSEAEPLYVQALELRRQLLGPKHPDVASSLNNLANLYASQGRYGEAEPLYLQAFAIAERQLGSKHPNTVTFRKNLESLRSKPAKTSFFKWVSRFLR